MTLAIISLIQIWKTSSNNATRNKLLDLLRAKEKVVVKYWKPVPCSLSLDRFGDFINNQGKLICTSNEERMSKVVPNHISSSLFAYGS